MCQSCLDCSTSSNYVGNTNTITSTMAGLPARREGGFRGERWERDWQKTKRGRWFWPTEGMMRNRRMTKYKQKQRWGWCLIKNRQCAKVSEFPAAHECITKDQVNYSGEKNLLQIKTDRGDKNKLYAWTVPLGWLLQLCTVFFVWKYSSEHNNS